MEKGVTGESYILGGENYDHAEILTCLSALLGWQGFVAQMAKD
jgi:hypothetical protein